MKGLTYLPSTVDSNTPTEFTRNPIDITELILASLGDVDSCEEYIIFLTSSKELYMYRTFLYDGKPKLAKVNENSYSSQLRSAYNEIASEDDTNESEDREEEELIKEKKLQDEHTKNGNTEKIQPHLHNYGFVGTYRGIVLSGECPAIILRGSQTCPIIHQLATGPFKAFTLFSTDFVYKGFAYLNKLHKTNLCILNEEVDYDCQFPARRICLGENVNHVAYHSKSNVYLVSTSKEISYQAVDEDEIPIPGLVEGLPKGTSFQGSLKLISPFNWTVIDELELAENEVIMCLKTMLLEVSEKSKRRNELIVFGTSVLRGEDLASKGSYYVYDAIDIIPEPGKPQTNRKLKELAKESLKGAITAICEVSGYLVVGQGQKVVVRNVQEDNTVIPVAFCDLSMYVSEAKSIKNLLILGDGLRSVWLVGFALEPYRMTVIAKDLDQIKVISSEFVTNNGNLYIVVADADKTLHLFQYDPDDPNSSGGQRLIKKSHFFIGKELRSSILVNMHSTGNEELIPLCGADDGSLSTVIPLEESSYRALFVMQEQIIDKEEHNACLNPRMYRNLGLLTAQERSLSRFLLDYNILQKFFTLDVQKKYNYSRKLGRNGEGQVWDSLAKVDRILDYI